MLRSSSTVEPESRYSLGCLWFRLQPYLIEVRHIELGISDNVVGDLNLLWHIKGPLFQVASMVAMHQLQLPLHARPSGALFR